MLKEIVINLVLVPTLDAITEPEYVNQTIAWLCEDSALNNEAFLAAVKSTDDLAELEAVKAKVGTGTTGTRTTGTTTTTTGTTTTGTTTTTTTGTSLRTTTTLTTEFRTKICDTQVRQIDDSYEMQMR